MSKQQKRISSAQFLSPTRIVAGVVLAGMLVLLFYVKSETDIGSAFAEFYLTVLISIYVLAWVILAIKSYFNK